MSRISLKREKGEISTIEEQVITSVKENELLSKNINTEFEQKLTFGERLADKISILAEAGIYNYFWLCPPFMVAVNSMILIWNRSIHIHSSFST